MVFPDLVGIAHVHNMHGPLCIVTLAVWLWLDASLLCALCVVGILLSWAMSLRFISVPSQCLFFFLLSLRHVGDAWWACWLLSWTAASFSASLHLSHCLAFVTLPCLRHTACWPWECPGPLSYFAHLAFSIGTALPKLCCLGCILGAVDTMAYYCV